MALIATGCSATHSTYDPRPRRVAVADVTEEIRALATELEERALLRTPLGSARVRVVDPEPVLHREARHRFAVLEERDVAATKTTIRKELEFALAGRLNVVDERLAIDGGYGEGAALATHEVDGTYLRTGHDIEISLRLVDLRDGWIVATAQRRIFGFVPRDYAERQQRQVPPVATRTASVERGSEALPLDAPSEGFESPAQGGGAAQGLTPEGGAPLGDRVEAVDGIPDDVPPDAVIEFEKGPAASRLKAVAQPGRDPMARDPESKDTESKDTEPRLPN